MNTLPTQRRTRSVWPGLAELFAGFPSWVEPGPVSGSHVLLLEDEFNEGGYEVRAEIPGIDPAKDVEITVRDGQLTISAKRSEKNEANGRSEFRYGSFSRTVSLPAGADEDSITATYDKGVLAISVPISHPEPSEKRIPVTSA